MANSEELIGATDYLKLLARCGVNRCLHNWVALYLNSRFYDQHCCSVFGLPSFYTRLRIVYRYE
jgi:hypothetical protein